MNITDKMREEDYDYVKSILNDIEYSLFIKLLKYEQKHSVRFAKEVKNLIDYIVVDDSDIVKNRDLLIKVSLLHDIGKSKTKVNIIDKSIIVILNKLTRGKLKNVNNKKVDCYYNHSNYSYELLKDIEDNKLLLLNRLLVHTFPFFLFLLYFVYNIYLIIKFLLFCINILY